MRLLPKSVFDAYLIDYFAGAASNFMFDGIFGA
jgi:hypothetical protein